MINIIYPCLWFDGNGKEAAEFYCSTFGYGKITADTPMVVNFELSGQKFMCLNGGPQFKINPSISFFVVFETEEETEKVWNKLLEGGSVLMPLDKYPWSEKYGWLQDKFGLSWQIGFGKFSNVGQKFTPSLMFVGDQHGRAEEAINFYTSLFKDSAVEGLLHFKEGEEGKSGSLQHGQFNLDKYVMMAMDSSLPHPFAFNEAISFVVECETQKEIDFYWNKFSDGGQESMCGWVKDRFDVWWQIIPSVLGKLMSDPSKSQKVAQAFMRMKKIEIEKLENA